jgi:hypothetical protein
MTSCFCIAAILFCIVQKYYLNKSCIFFQVLLPHIISEPKKSNWHSWCLDLRTSRIAHFIIIIIIVIVIVVVVVVECRKLQSMALEQWAVHTIKVCCDELGLLVNPDKTGLVAFTTRRKLPGFFEPCLFGTSLHCSMSSIRE